MPNLVKGSWTSWPPYKIGLLDHYVLTSYLDHTIPQPLEGIRKPTFKLINHAKNPIYAYKLGCKEARGGV